MFPVFRQVTAIVEHRPEVLRGVSMLMVYRWPRGVYVDPYELASLRDQSDWQVTVTELCIHVKKYATKHHCIFVELS